mmetsp:Transcript_18844/g.45534  ORF Transcript_18844/g.45534 Transcript_18844/m.45534 type:complete len:858 (-) Transcript_18844:141-2714(-)
MNIDGVGGINIRPTVTTMINKNSRRSSKRTRRRRRTMLRGCTSTTMLGLSTALLMTTCTGSSSTSASTSTLPHSPLLRSTNHVSKETHDNNNILNNINSNDHLSSDAMLPFGNDELLRPRVRRRHLQGQEQQQQQYNDEQQHQRQGQENSCFNNLYLSDADGDSRVDAEEYVTFVKLEGPTDFLEDDVNTFQQLPLMLQSNFFTLACFCTSGPDCCQGDNAHISADGTAPGTTPTPEESSYLNLVCSFTSNAVDRVVEASAVPTPVPTSAPTEATSPPTPDPTPAPTSPPTPGPTGEPTPLSTPLPTEATPLPTSPPTTLPPQATPSPTSATTTMMPTGDGQQTATPTASPTIIPGPGPSGDDGSSTGAASPGVVAGASIAGIAMILSIGYLIKSDNTKNSSRGLVGKKSDYGYGSDHDKEEIKTIPSDEKPDIDKQPPGFRTKNGPPKTGQPQGQEQNLSVAGEEKISADDDLALPEGDDIDDSNHVFAVPVPYIGSGGGVTNQESFDVDDDGSQSSSNDRSQVSQESDAGWSEAYSSSMGTMSDDEMLPDIPGQDKDQNQHVVTLSVATSEDLLSSADEKKSPENKLEDLEDAIMAGDWVAVGETAATLATMQYDSQSQSRSELSKSSVDVSNVSSKRSERWKESIDAKKAAELDELIEKGDWEGIISAAGRYETETTTVGGGSGGSSTRGSGRGDSSSDMMNEVVVPRNDDDDAANMASFEDDIMVHEDNSDDEMDTEDPYRTENTKKHDPEETRRRVVSLVQEVVPEELDNVDEMIGQFAGREEDLLETLETMKQRASARESNKKKNKSEGDDDEGGDFGDWSAVGATATLLDTQAYNTDEDSSKDSGSSNRP